MPKEPSAAIFRCESCGKACSADARMSNHLLPAKRKLPITDDGRCPACNGASWTLSVQYAESGLDAEPSAIGLGLAATTGVGFVQHSTSVNQIDYPHVPAQAVAAINADPKRRMERIAELANQLERRYLQERGARECRQCGMLYAPVAHKPWTESGYCSKMCAVADGSSVHSNSPPPAGGEPSAPAKTVRISCPAGHPFEVPISFRGMIRRCPKCNAKTPVPE